MPSAHGVRALLADLLRRQGRPAEAADELAPMLEGDDTTPALRRLAGELELLAGRPERALPQLRLALAAQPAAPRMLQALYETLRRDRQSVVKGKGVDVRFAHGVLGAIKKK